MPSQSQPQPGQPPRSQPRYGQPPIVQSAVQRLASVRPPCAKRLAPSAASGSAAGIAAPVPQSVTQQVAPGDPSMGFEVENRNVFVYWLDRTVAALKPLVDGTHIVRVTEVLDYKFYHTLVEVPTIEGIADTLVTSTAGIEPPYCIVVVAPNFAVPPQMWPTFELTLIQWRMEMVLEHFYKRGGFSPFRTLLWVTTGLPYEGWSCQAYQMHAGGWTTASTRFDQIPVPLRYSYVVEVAHLACLCCRSGHISKVELPSS